MPDQLLLGLDLGTSSVKAGIVDAAGRLLGLGRHPYPTSFPEAGWAECDPEHWWQGFCRALAEASQAAGVTPTELTAVGLSVQYPSVMPLAADGRVLAPAVLYCDQRSAAQAAALKQRLPAGEYEARIGNRLVPGTCAVSSLLWWREHRPAVWREAACFGFVNTLAVQRLTGEWVTDPSNTSLSGLVAVRDLWTWSPELTALAGVDPARLPRIGGADQIAGAVTPAAAAATGLRAGTPVTYGCGDVVAAVFGAGVTNGADGAVYIAGSSDNVTVVMPRPGGSRQCVNSGNIGRGDYLGTGTSTSSGTSVEWFARTVLDAADGRAVADLAATAPPGSHGVLFLPYLQGERTPVWDPAARGLFQGLTAATTRADLARAVLEGVAFALRQLVTAVEAHAGQPIPRLRAVGGGTRLALWNQLKADATGRPLHILEFQETGVLGAALLAGVAVGAWPSLAAAAATARAEQREQVVSPDPATRAVYDERFSLYARLFPALGGLPPTNP